MTVPASRGAPGRLTLRDPILELDDATVVKDDRRVLDGLTLTIHQGEHTVILGPNGAGKSVLVNLLTNAIESLGITQGRHRRITIRSSRADGHDVLLEVNDNGVGIAPEDMAQIFEAFFTTKPTGTGLGLSLCRTIAETHGGHLWATPGETGGVTFHLQLPQSGLHES